MINVTPTAASKISGAARRGAEGRQRSPGVRPGWRLLRLPAYGLMIDEGNTSGDQVFGEQRRQAVRRSDQRALLEGRRRSILVDTVTGGGFTIKNPQAVSTCGCGQSFSV